MSSAARHLEVGFSDTRLGEELSAGALKAPSVLIASDVRLYREGLAALLADGGRVEVVGTVAEADLTSYLSKLDPDILLIDTKLLNARGCATVLTSGSTAKVIAFAASEHDILACAKSGVSSFVGKDACAEDVMAAIEGLTHGELLCPPRLAWILFQSLTLLARSQAHGETPAGLTIRELEVISLLNQGHSNKEIARELGIGPATVKNHVHNILQKLHVHRRGMATVVFRNV